LQCSEGSGGQSGNEGGDKSGSENGGESGGEGGGEDVGESGARGGVECDGENRGESIGESGGEGGGEGGCTHSGGEGDRTVGGRYTHGSTPQSPQNSASRGDNVSASSGDTEPTRTCPRSSARRRSCLEYGNSQSGLRGCSERPPAPQT
jgi:hypothetical protein